MSLLFSFYHSHELLSVVALRALIQKMKPYPWKIGLGSVAQCPHSQAGPDGSRGPGQRRSLAYRVSSAEDKLKVLEIIRRRASLSGGLVLFCFGSGRL